VNNYNVTLITTSNKGCSDTAYKTLSQVYAQPKAHIKTNTVDTCFGQQVVFSDISDGITRPFTKWLWQFGDASTSIVKNPPPKVYAAPGLYKVKLSGFTDVGCPSDIDSVMINIDQLPTADFKFSNPRCEKNAITFTDQSTGNSGNLIKWVYDMGNGQTNTYNTQPVFPFTYNTAGIYDVTVEVTTDDGCIKKSSPVSVIVAPLPVANTGGPQLTMLEGGVLQLKGYLSTGAGLSYLWTPVSYLDSPLIAGPHVSPPDDIRYYLKVTSSAGCVDTSSVFVKVLKAPRVPNIFTPNGDGINDRWLIEFLETYPNCVVEVYTPAGQLVYRNVGYLTAWDGTRNGKPLPDGTYYYIIDPKNGRKIQTGSVTIIR
jgi:gliding motility-associated-like protein